jgi:hypothetical protein
LAAILIIFFTSLYASEQFRKLWFPWFYMNIFSLIVKGGSESVRAKLFKKLSTIQPKDPSKKLVKFLDFIQNYP